ncbi:MAG TPA: response regulator transcription factor [Dehalococcoidia bacterium]|nr:response regulator transcription factor [Dehalococcoidia bacterium]
MKTVLVIGERPEQANALAQSLGILGVEAIASARDLKLVVRSLLSHDTALIVMDVDASEDSRAFFEMLCELSDLPVIVRGPMSNSDLVIAFLERGALDYVGKTTTPAVLAAKIHPLLRSNEASSAAEMSSVINVGEITIDLQRRVVFRGLEEIALTPLEFRLLSVLAENAGRPCAHKKLLESVWGADFLDCSHYLRLYIGYLRQKLEDDPRRPKLLLNEWGYGYRLAEPKASKRGARAVLRLAQG